MKKFQLSALAISVAFFISGCKNQNEQGGQNQMPPQSVTYQTIKTSPVEITSSLSGRLVASEDAEVRPQITGIIRSFNVKDGQDVQQGDVLYQIEPAPYEAAFKQAQASLKSIEADIKSAKAKSERYADLAKEKAIPQQDADDALAIYNKLLANLDERKAALELAKLNLDYTQIKAPISGKLGIASITTGALVTANQSEKINTITKLDPIYLDITQTSSEFLHMKSLAKQFNSESIPVTITIKGKDNSPSSSEEFKGVLISQEAIVDPQTDSVKIRAKFDNPDKSLLPGMYATAKVTFAVNPEGITVPLQSVLHDNDKRYVYLLSDDNSVKKQEVSILFNTFNESIIKDGLKDGDKIVFKGVGKVRDGAVVAPTEDK